MNRLFRIIEFRVTFLIAVIVATLAPPAFASALEKAQPFLPLLSQTVGEHWPQAPLLSYFAAKVEQETCITPRHAKCWNPRAELKTSRENGVGFGQITIAYRADGSVRFDKFAELRAAHASLRDWQWSDRYDPAMQLTAMVLMDKTSHRRFQGMYETVYDGLAFSASAYNGGEGGLLQDRRLCANRPGCNPMRWVDNVALHSAKSRVKWQGYGQSAYDINRGYVQKVLYERRQKYVTTLGT